MNDIILNQYGIRFQKEDNYVLVFCDRYPIVSIFLNRFSSDKSEVREFLQAVNLAITGNFHLIAYDHIEWTKELGFQLYSGRINNNMTFDLFMDDHYDKTLQTFPLSDIKEIFDSLLEFIS